jgi:hypothetical protein
MRDVYKEDIIICREMIISIGVEWCKVSSTETVSRREMQRSMCCGTGTRVPGTGTMYSETQSHFIDELMHRYRTER